MSKQTLELQLEALLLASPEPIKLDRIYEIAEADEVDKALQSLGDFWRSRGMRVQVKSGAAALIPSPVHARVLSEVQGGNARLLSSAAVETLCFIAVHQPVTVGDIEKARGLKMFKGVMDSLLDAGLIRSSIRRTDAGRAVAYVTTDAFLDHFGLASLADIPSAEELAEMGKPFSDEFTEVP